MRATGLSVVGGAGVACGLLFAGMAGLAAGLGLPLAALQLATAVAFGVMTVRAYRRDESPSRVRLVRRANRFGSVVGAVLGVGVALLALWLLVVALRDAGVL